jgi:hypothetical protein
LWFTRPLAVVRAGGGKCGARAGPNGDRSLSTGQNDLPLGASVALSPPSAGGSLEEIVSTIPKAMFEAIEQFKAWGGKGNARVQDNKDGTWSAIREGAGPGPQPPGGVVPNPPQPPRSGGLLTPGVANAPGGVAQHPPGTAVPRNAPSVPDAANLPPGALTDPEGRLITAPYVAGVRTPGGPDVGGVHGVGRAAARDGALSASGHLPRYSARHFATV